MGGGQLYAELLCKADVLYLTQINLEVKGDTYFPEWDDGSWLLKQTISATNEHGLQYSFNTFVKNCKLVHELP
jgi:dihydrofolate reductase